jgi:glutathione peroxidase-family protein
MDQKDDCKNLVDILLQVLHCFLQGLRILGFPCNQFGGQEPGTDEEIKVDSDENNWRNTVFFDPWIRDPGWKKI